MYRHHPAMARLEELSGTIGVLDSVAATFDMLDPGTAAPDDPARDWRQDADRAGGVPWDLACYCVDACNRFASARPARVLAVADRSARYGTVDRLHGLIEYENGVVSQYPISEAEVTPSGVLLHLGSKHTTCLAQDRCGIGSVDVACCPTPGCC